MVGSEFSNPLWVDPGATDVRGSDTWKTLLKNPPVPLVAGFQLRGQDFPRNSGEGCGCHEAATGLYHLSRQGCLATSSGKLPAPGLFLSVPGKMSMG